MQKFFEDICVLDDAGDIITLSGASVYVYEAGTSNLATIYSDDGVTPKDNPFTAEDDGSFEFYAANGRYDIRVHKAPYKPNTILDILFDDSSVATSGSFSSGLSVATSADTSLYTRLSVVDSQNLSTTTSADTSVVSKLESADSVITSEQNSANESVVTRLSTVDSANLSTAISADSSVVTRDNSYSDSVNTSIITRLSTVDSGNLSSLNSADTSLTTRDSTITSVVDSADTSVVTRLSTVDSGNLSTSISAADSAAALAGEAGTSESYVNSADTSVITRLSTADSTVLSTAESFTDSADTSVITRLSTVDSTNLSTAQSAADSAATLATGGAVDNVVRDDVVLLAWQLQIETGLGSLGFEDGVADEFEDETGVDTEASENEDYDSSDDCYSPAAGTIVDNMEYASDELAQAAYVTNGVDTDQKQNTTGHTHSVTGSLALYAGALSDMSDGNTANSIIVINGNGTVRIDFGASTPKTIKKFRIFIKGSASITGCLFRGSNNATNWDTLITHPSEVVVTNWSTQRTVSSPASYRYYEWVYNVGGKGAYLTEWELLGDNTNYQSYSESTIKSQGSYSLKGMATTDALNKTLTRTIGSPIDLSGVDIIKFDIRSSRTGSNIKIGIHDSGGTTTEITPNITDADTFQEVELDLSGVADADKDAIDSIIVTIVNADSANTFYIDAFAGLLENMTLISNSVEAESEPTTARLLALVEPVDAITINTDLLGYISNDGGSNYDQVTLAKVGEFDDKDLYVGNVTLTDRSDQTMVQKLVTANKKNLKVHAWAMLWR